MTTYHSVPIDLPNFLENHRVSGGRGSAKHLGRRAHKPVTAPETTRAVNPAGDEKRAWAADNNAPVNPGVAVSNVVKAFSHSARSVERALCE